jgi:hypothetical protein
MNQLAKRIVDLATGEANEVPAEKVPRPRRPRGKKPNAERGTKGQP